MATDRVNSVKTIQDALRRVGVYPYELKLTDCPVAVKPPHCTYIDRFTGKTNIRETDGILEFFEYANQWLKKNGKASVWRHRDLFHIVMPELVLADLDPTPGPDTALYESDEGWIELSGDLSHEINAALQAKMMGLAEGRDAGEVYRLLNETTVDWAKLAGLLKPYGWKAHSLALTGSEFSAEHFGLNVPVRPNDPELFGPFHQVFIQSDPPREIPWSDPYLLCLWESSLLKKSVEITATREGRAFDKTYRFKGRKVYEIKEEGDRIRIRHFSPTGSLIGEKTIVKPPIEAVEVSGPVGTEPSLYSVKVHGADLAISARYDEGTSPGKITEHVRELGQALQILPRSLIRPLLLQHGAEKPITLALATGKTAKFFEKTQKSQTNYAGLYYRDLNEAIIKMEGSQAGWNKTAYHEILGHGIDDFLAPMDADSYFTEQNLPLQYYYISKLMPLFTPTALVDYDEHIQQRTLSSFKDLPWEDRDKNQSLSHASDRILQEKFSSIYAGSGTSIIDQLTRPVEFFAENMTYFYLSLAGYSRELPERLHAEPLYRLIGLDYLMHRYGFDSIGGLGRRELFSFEGMRMVLGMDLASKAAGLEEYRANALNERLLRYMGGRREGISPAPTLSMEYFIGEGPVRIAAGAQLQLDHRKLEASPGIFVSFLAGASLMALGDLTDVWSIGAKISTPEKMALQFNLNLAGLLKDGQFMPGRQEVTWGASLSSHILLPLWGNAKLSVGPGVSFWPDRENPLGVGLHIALPVQ